ncbi:beta-galactosidase GalA [Xanthomonas maliensis]|uniref:beta-galactosidase GalA n=1 Tax=Xanthomonas maliensis TaxID=1321368 RepID=UPI0003A5DCB7|nr:beta-galactosidase GalA [Xanthomonas maliensis]KAB7767858.1 beta-galactosidase [Xanthomonas maliensis]
MRRREFLIGGACSGALLGASTPLLAGAALPGPMAAHSGAIPASAGSASVPLAAGDGLWLDLDAGWRFHLGDLPTPPLLGQDETYDNAKAGRARGAAAPDFDDSGWRELQLPHDFVVEQPVRPNANIAQGYRPRGIAWYRRSLRLHEAWRGRAVELRLDGISSHATVWVNGMLMARSWSGYNGLAIDLTAIARYGQDINTIAIRVDAEAMDGWWYEGGGVYRHTWLVVRTPLHIASDGVAVLPREGPDDRWQVPVAVELVNSDATSTVGELAVELRDPDDRVIARGQAQVTVDAFASAQAQVTLSVTQPQRWDLAAPRLYRVLTSVSSRHGSDRTMCEIGFRSLRFDAEQGFFLNGRPLKIKGVCLHQDHAGVGVAMPDSLHTFRLQRLQSMGCNAIRLHHAVAPELLQACDRLGMLVMAENRLFNASPDGLALLRDMVRRQRNHPSVFLWSLFNEEPLQGTTTGKAIAARAAAAVRALDPTRPLTAGMNDGMLSAQGAADVVDVLGFNYRQFNYDRVHAARPHTPLLSSEDTSAFQTRGAWFTDLPAHVVAEDDSLAAEWGNTHRRAWQLIAERPFVAGSFVWTGFDYRGEPTPFEWPSVASFFGILDQCGFPKGAYWLRRALWIEAEPVLHVLPHWNWPGRDGQSIKVMAFCNAEQVELWLNGRSLGRQAVDRVQMNAWSVAYAPGVLEAVAWRDGQEVARTRVETTGAAVALRLSADRPQLRGDGRDAVPVTLEAVDAQGRHVPDCNALLTLDVEGGRLLGVGNGDPNGHDPDQATQVRLFNGLAQAIVQAGRGAGTLRVAARSAGLHAGRLVVARTAVALPPVVDVADAAMVIGGWRHTAAFAQAPSPDLPRQPNDNNSWSNTWPGTLEVAPERAGYVLFRSVFTPWQGVQARGGVLALGRLSGPAQVFLDGHAVARARAGEPLQLPLPPGSGPRTVAVVLQVAADQPFGFHDIVTVHYGNRS